MVLMPSVVLYYTTLGLIKQNLHSQSKKYSRELGNSPINSPSRLLTIFMANHKWSVEHKIMNHDQ